MFFGSSGLRAVWCVVLFVAIFDLFDTALLTGLGRVVSLRPLGPIPPLLAVAREAAELLALIGATAIMARIERRSLLSFGFGGEHRFARLAGGAACGLTILTLLVAALYQGGWITFGSRAPLNAAALGYGGIWLLVFLMVGAFEEGLLRGYLQVALARGIGFWGAAIVLSVAFAVWHHGNAGESLVGLLSVGAGGMVFCLSLWYTRSLWWSVGFHTGWDWGQSFLYGTPNSGWLMQGSFLASRAAGDPIWSGGTAGPEGSVLMLPLFVLTATGMWLWWGRRPRTAFRNAREEAV